MRGERLCDRRLVEPRSGGRAVVSAERSLPVLASVGVFDGIARLPTDGARLVFRTTMLPRAWIFVPPTGSAMNQYRPAVGVVDLRHVDSVRVRVSPPGTPIGSSRAIVVA